MWRQKHVNLARRDNNLMNDSLNRNELVARVSFLRATRDEFLRQLDRIDEARQSCMKALQRSGNRFERGFLEQRLAGLSEPA